ncbi:Ubiquitin carboxyl-terminal hydrolase CYLD [Dirofilaria immitis]
MYLGFPEIGDHLGSLDNLRSGYLKLLIRDSLNIYVFRFMQGSIKRFYEQLRNTELLSPSAALHHCTGSAIEPKIPFGNLLKKPLSLPTIWQDDHPRILPKVMTNDTTDHRALSTSLITSLLLENYDGKMYDRKRKQFSAKIKVERGHLLRSVAESDLCIQSFNDMHNEINNPTTRNILFMKCLEVGDVYLRVPTTKVALLTDFETSLLKAVSDIEIRFRFHQYSDLFNFVSQLSVGDRVIVQLKSETSEGEIEECFKPGWVEWFGEPVPDNGFLFGIRLDSAIGDMDGFFNGRRLFAAPHNGAVLVSGDRLRNPRNVSILDEDSTFSDYGLPSHLDHSDDYSLSRNIPSHRPVVREVPIKIVPTTAGSHNQAVQLRCSTSSISPAIGKFPVNDMDEILMNLDINRSHQSQQKANINMKVSSSKKPLYDNISLGTSLLKDSSRSLSGTRSVKLPVAVETIRLKSNEGELMEGDRIVWFDAMGIPRRGTARWIGYLRGHTNIYIGVDFDEAIGGGTGYFECVELFRCAPNHAGLLPVSVCMKESDMGDEENNTSYIRNLHLQRFPSEPQQQQQQQQPSPSSSTRIHNDISSLQPESLANEKENGETSKLPQFTIGSCVEILYRNERRCGVVKWISNNNELIESNRLVAVEIEGDLPYDWRTIDKVQLEDAHKAGVFASASSDSIALVPYCALRCDDRFALSDTSESNNNYETKTMMSSNFGSLDSGIEVRPCLPVKNMENLLGRMKGIQGFRNSCYLDTTLYAMFAQCSAFDSILESKCETEADSIHTEVTDILKTEIVYPLRKFHFVRADHVLKLRRLLEMLIPKMGGLTTDEKDPEELLNALFNTVLRVEPFVVMRNTTDGKTNPAYICPLITEDLWSEEQRRLISVQALLERSLFASNIQFACEPKILILQLPRYGQQKVFDKIFPPQEVDITHLIYEGKRPCINCGKRADMMCPECFLTREVFIREVTYCGICYEQTHNGLDHQPQQLSASNNSFSVSSSLSLSRRMQVPQKKLQLASVLCIETSHYVAFVHALYANKWVFFDSMADRVGLSDGFNVPQVKLCEKMSNWLSDTGWCRVRDCINREGHLPNDVESDSDLMRLLSDCYICFYTDEENKNEGMAKKDKKRGRSETVNNAIATK